MVPNIDYDYIIRLRYSIVYKEYYLTRFNHQQTLLMFTKGLRGLHAHVCQGLPRAMYKALRAGLSAALGLRSMSFGV